MKKITLIFILCLLCSSCKGEEDKSLSCAAITLTCEEQIEKTRNIDIYIKCYDAIKKYKCDEKKFKETAFGTTKEMRKCFYAK